MTGQNSTNASGVSHKGPSQNLIERLQGGNRAPTQPLVAQNQPIIKKTKMQMVREEQARNKRVSDFNPAGNATMSPRFGTQAINAQVPPPRFQLNNTFGGQSSVVSRPTSQINQFQAAVQNTTIHASQPKFQQPAFKPFVAPTQPVNPFAAQNTSQFSFKPANQPATFQFQAV